MQSTFERMPAEKQEVAIDDNVGVGGVDSVVDDNEAQVVSFAEIHYS